MRKYPEHFEPYFTWRDDVISPTTVLEMLEVEDDLVDYPVEWDWFQEYILESKDEGREPRRMARASHNATAEF